MILKQRKGPTSYTTIEDDLKKHSVYQEYYSNNFLSHPIYSGGNHHFETEKIKKEWSNIEPKGHRNLQSDLADLNAAYSHVKAKETLYRMLLHQSFRKLYSYLKDLIQDYEIGYLSDDLFLKYMQEYNSLVEKNKVAGLDCWDKEGYAELSKQINHIAQIEN